MMQPYAVTREAFEHSYRLAFVQLTWQVDNGWFSPVFDDFFHGVH